MIPPSRAQQINDRAADWFATIDGGGTPEQHEAFQHWLSENPRHRVAYLRIEAAARELERLRVVVKRDGPIDADLFAPGKRRKPRARRSSMRWLFTVTVASTVSIVAAGVLLLSVTNRLDDPLGAWLAKSYATPAGERRTVALENGNVAYLNTRTRILFRPTRTEQRVELIAGEALFDIKPNSSRPFRVVLGSSEVRVLGTRFNVYRKPNDNTVITVLDGTVEVRGYAPGTQDTVWVRRLGQNEQLEYDPARVVEPRRVAAGSTDDWREGVYAFDEQPIGTVAAELGRYTDYKVVLEGRCDEMEPVTGRLRTTDALLALMRLETISSVKVRRANDSIVLECP